MYWAAIEGQFRSDPNLSWVDSKNARDPSHSGGPMWKPDQLQVLGSGLWRTRDWSYWEILGHFKSTAWKGYGQVFRPDNFVFGQSGARKTTGPRGITQKEQISLILCLMSLGRRQITVIACKVCVFFRFESLTLCFWNVGFHLLKWCGFLLCIRFLLCGFFIT